MPEAVTIDPRFIVNLKGRDYPTYAGVLDAATKAGLKSLKVNPLQIPAEDNGWTAVVEAVAEFEDGRIFSDVGDASPKNCSPQIATAALRMASTRGKGRVLRDSINCGMTLLEEIPDDEQAREGNGKGAGVHSNPVQRPGAGRPAQARSKVDPDTSSVRPEARAVVGEHAEAADGKPVGCEVCGQILDAKALKGCTEKPEWFGGKMLCIDHAREYRITAERAKVPAAAVAA